MKPAFGNVSESLGVKKTVQIVDYPGHQRMKASLPEYSTMLKQPLSVQLTVFIDRHMRSAKAVVLVIDSTDLKQVRVSLFLVCPLSLSLIDNNTTTDQAICGCAP